MRNVATDLARVLLADEAIASDALSAALHAHTAGGLSLVRALLEHGGVSRAALESVCGRSDAPQVSRVVPLAELVTRLPTGLCERLYAVPVRRDPTTGTVDVAVVDTNDLHAAREIAFHLGATVRIVRASLDAMEEAFAEAVPDTEVEPRPRAHLVIATDPPPAAVILGPQGPVAPRRDTPPWGTPVHSAPPSSEAPRVGLGSEIPIPLTRRTYTAVSGGTQRPPPLRDAAAMGEGYALDGQPDEPAIELQVVRPGSLPDVELDVPSPPRAPTLHGVGLAGPALPPSEHPRSLPPADKAEKTRQVIAALQSATSRDGILDLLLEGSRLVARRVALFVVKKGGYQGWSGTTNLGPREVVQGVSVPLDAGSMLDEAVRDGVRVGPIERRPANLPITALFGRTEAVVAVVPVRVLEKAAVLVFADDLDDAMNAPRHIDELAAVAGDALTRLVKGAASVKKS